MLPPGHPSTPLLAVAEREPCSSKQNPLDIRRCCTGVEALGRKRVLVRIGAAHYQVNQQPPTAWTAHDAMSTVPSVEPETGGLARGAYQRFAIRGDRVLPRGQRNLIRLQAEGELSPKGREPANTARIAQDEIGKSGVNWYWPGGRRTGFRLRPRQERTPGVRSPMGASIGVNGQGGGLGNPRVWADDDTVAPHRGDGQGLSGQFLSEWTSRKDDAFRRYAAAGRMHRLDPTGFGLDPLDRCSKQDGAIRFLGKERCGADTIDPPVAAAKRRHDN